jgi:hypothetical protein
MCQKCEYTPDDEERKSVTANNAIAGVNVDVFGTRKKSEQKSSSCPRKAGSQAMPPITEEVRQHRDCE